MITILYITIASLYLITIASLIIGFNKVAPFHFQNLKAKTAFSVIIPFKNEEQHLNELVNSIEQLNYPKDLFQIIFIDDNSIDNSKALLTQLIASCNIEATILDNPSPSKKSAITYGITQAKYDWIVTSDADCMVPTYWLDCFDERIQTYNDDVFIGPVTYSKFNTFFKRFQALDVLSLQGTSIGAFGLNKPFLCNGANMAYKKSLFNSLKGFDGNETIASGDDIFFLEKASKSKAKIGYLKTVKAVVLTHPEASLTALIQQRKRWASKTSATKSTFGKFVAFIVFVMNLALIAGFLLALTTLLPWKTLFYIFFIKVNIDFLLIYKSAVLLDTKSPLVSYWLACFIYPFFSSYIAIVSMFSTYKWKGVSYSK